jgi:flagellar biosynthesis chaperone FliJ
MRMRACLLALILLLSACNGEKRRLQERLTSLGNEQAELSRRLETRRSAVRDTSQQIQTLNSAIAAGNSEMDSFMAAHRIAAGCIRASRSTWDEGNAHDVPTAATVGAALCSVALFNRTFAAEITAVTRRLDDAAAHTRNLKEQIATLETTLETERSELKKCEAAAEQNAAEIADAQLQLAR